MRRLRLNSISILFTMIMISFYIQTIGCTNNEKNINREENMGKEIIIHEKSEKRLIQRVKEFLNYEINKNYEMQWDYLCSSNKASNGYSSKKEYIDNSKESMFRLKNYETEGIEVIGNYGQVLIKTKWEPFNPGYEHEVHYWIYEKSDWYYDIKGINSRDYPDWDKYKPSYVNGTEEPEVEKSWDEATEKKLVARAEEFSNHLIDQDTEKAWKYLSDKCKEETYVWSTQKKFKEDVKKNFNEATCTEYSVITVESILDNEAKLMTKFTCSVKDNKAQDYYWRETWVYENGDWFYVSKAFWN